jgi:DNA-binding MarR family transcriptional regulator
MLVNNILDSINSLLTIAQHKVYLKYVNVLEPFDLTPGQYEVLHYLWLHKDQNSTPKSISDFLCLEFTSVSRMLDILQKKDLINRALNENNHRRIKVTTTKKSDALKEKLEKTIDTLNKEINKGLTKKDYDSLMKMLRMISDIEEK